MSRTSHRFCLSVVIAATAVVLPLALGPTPATRADASGRAASAPAVVAVATRTLPTAAPAAVPGAPGAGDPYFPTYGNGGYDVRHYNLRVRYNPATDVLSGRATLRARATQSLSRFDLDLVGLTVRTVTVNGRRATWTREGDQELVVTPRRPLRRSHSFTVTVQYSGVPVPFTDPNLGTYGFLTTRDGAIAIGEPQVAAHWYPSNDHPSDKATYRIALTVPKDLQAVSNGLPSAPVVRGRWATTTWRVRHPMASYLAFMAVGRFDIHRWRTGNGLPVIDAVDPAITGPLRARIDASFARQGEMLEAETSWFGRYPYEAAGGLVDQVDVGFALENQTRPTYSSGFWNIPQLPTLGDDVVVHELAHQWYGDSVALDRWRDVWLNEGFATYAEWLWHERQFGFTPQETFDAVYATPADDPLWKLRIGDPGPQHLFDDPVYRRGALTLQALRMTVGDHDFFRILRAWARVHRDGNGTTAQFIALAEQRSGRQLDRLFHDWLFTASKPPRSSAGGFAGPSAAGARSAGRAAQVDAAVQRWTRSLQTRIALERP
jgi:aminopeptidase N